MSLLINNNLKYYTEKFNKEDSCYELINRDKKNDIIRVKYPLEILDDYTEDDFDIYFFTNYQIKENDIFQVCEKNSERVGWIFPLIALSSKDHSYVDNEHFLKYASVTFKKLIRNNNGFILKTIPDPPGGSYDLIDLYDGDLIVFTVCKDKINEDFRISDYIPSFYSYGYYHLDMKQQKIDLNNYKAITESEFKTYRYKEFSEKIIHIKPVSNFFIEHLYIRELFTNLLKIENNPILRFLFLYQVIEILIESIFISEAKEILIKVGENKIDYYNFQSTLNDLNKEAKRINILFSQCVKETSNFVSMISSSEKLLINFFEVKSDIFVSEAIYKVRNLIIHNYSKLLKYEKLMEDIVKYFEFLVIDVLHSIEMNK